MKMTNKFVAGVIKRILIIIIFLFLITLPAKIFAASEFSNTYEVLYDVAPDGNTAVSEKVTVTNLTDTYYVSSFTMSIGSTTLSDISASDGSGKMEKKVGKD